jgi:hypothetical protein
MAILDKIGSSSSSTVTPSSSSTSTSSSTTKQGSSAGVTLASTMQNYDQLKNKPLPYLKALAKQMKIKISKLSKEQLITSILEKASSSGSPLPVLDVGSISATTTSDLMKLSKNILLTKATELGFSQGSTSKNTKKDLIDFIISKGTSTSTSSPVVPSTTITKPTKTTKKSLSQISFPITEGELQSLKKSLTIPKIKEILKANDISIPKGTTKKEVFLTLLLKIQPSSTISNQSSVTTTPTVSDIVPSATSVGSVPAVEEEPEVDVVSLDDISSPFVPANVRDLTDEPSEDALREDVMRCLKFYDYPS